MKHKGYTLVEALVSVAIFSVLVMGLFDILGVGTSVYMKSVPMIDLQQEARNAMDRMVRDLRSARIPIVTPIDQNSDRISFNAPQNMNVEYYKDGTFLVRLQNPDVLTTLVAQDVTYLKFTLTGALVTISLRVERVFNNQKVTFPLVEQVRLRNE
ncbi:MAG: prepilin-type N-terminal cleavage/methylation domain-containing protein [Candidatus Omnitrophica bacterium]|nr:prepilin-type N-terminal cleavage/methylation domain-containing protein [Candidatus Omnitrophota bacterium]